MSPFTQRCVPFAALASTARRGGFVAIFTLTVATVGWAQTGKRLPVLAESPAPILASRRVGTVAPDALFHVVVALKPRNLAALEAFANRVSSPSNADYRKFLSPEEIGERFGPTDAEFKEVETFLRSNGFRITMRASNRLTLLADATEAQAATAFGTSFVRYRPLAEPGSSAREFYAPSEPPTVPANIAPLIQHLGGLDSYRRHAPRLLTPIQTRGLYNLSALFTGQKLGQGRRVAISSWDGFNLKNVPLYYTKFSLPTPKGGVGSNITVVPIEGGSQGGFATGEGDLDIQMVLGMAPQCDLTVYDGGMSLLAVLAAEAQDNKADIVTESYGWNLSASEATAAHNLHLAMTAAGITYIAASGDKGTTLEPYSYPNYEPEVLLVGGTVSTVDSQNRRKSTAGWSLSGGGYTTKAVSFNKLPSWQQGTGVPKTLPYRLGPDLALNAAGTADGAYPYFYGRALVSGDVGTSFAAPVLAGQVATVEQSLISSGALPATRTGLRRLGRLQDTIYAQNGDASLWYDVRSGTNGVLPSGSPSKATVGWDFVTGWGEPNLGAFTAKLSERAVHVTIFPSTFTVLSGTAVLGGASQLTQVDGNYLSVTSAVTPSGNGETIQLQFPMGSMAPYLTTLSLTVVSRSSSPSVQCGVWAYDVTTKTWQTIGSPAISTSRSPTIQVVVDPSRYLTAAGNVLIQLRASKTTDLAVPFRLDVDSAYVTVTY